MAGTGSDRDFQRPWQVRPCPADFPDVFIREGWRGVELEFGARTAVNKRWLHECGGEALRQRRAEFLKSRTRARKPMPVPAPQRPYPQPSRDELAAIAFLRSPDGGSWAITATGEGDFYFGCTRLSGAQLVERARRKGWDGSGDMLKIASTLALLRA